MRSHLKLSALMTSEMANASGEIHGGRIIAMLDNAAYACAMRFCGTRVVTRRVTQLDFLQPLSVGDVISVNADIIRTGRSSMDVAIEVDAECLLTGRNRRTHSGRFIMVAVGMDGRPCDVRMLAQTKDGSSDSEAVSLAETT